MSGEVAFRKGVPGTVQVYEDFFFRVSFGMLRATRIRLLLSCPSVPGWPLLAPGVLGDESSTKSLLAAATATSMAPSLTGDDGQDVAFPARGADRDLVSVGFFVAFVFGLPEPPESPGLTAAVEDSGLATSSIIIMIVTTLPSRFRQ